MVQPPWLAADSGNLVAIVAVNTVQRHWIGRLLPVQGGRCLIGQRGGMARKTDGRTDVVLRQQPPADAGPTMNVRAFVQIAKVLAGDRAGMSALPELLVDFSMTI